MDEYLEPSPAQRLGVCRRLRSAPAPSHLVSPNAFDLVEYGGYGGTGGVGGARVAAAAAAGSLAHRRAAASTLPSHVYIVVHSIDGPAVRSDEAQALLASIASIPQVHVIASCSHRLDPAVLCMHALGCMHLCILHASCMHPACSSSTRSTRTLAHRSATRRRRARTAPAQHANACSTRLFPPTSITPRRCLSVSLVLALQAHSRPWAHRRSRVTVSLGRSNASECICVHLSASECLPHQVSSPEQLGRFDCVRLRLIASLIR